MADIKNINLNGTVYNIVDDEAQKTADAAQKTADAAQKTADAAQKTADAAQKTADAAQKTADVARVRQNILAGSETGNPVAVDDAFAAPLCGLTVYGKSTQDGTPTPDAPVPIVSAGDVGTILVTVGDSTDGQQTITLQTPNGLPGIPVKSGGNYTDQNGQHWVCDEVDLEKGVKVQRVTTIVFFDASKFWDETTTGGIRFSTRVNNLKDVDKGIVDANAFCSALSLGSKGETWSIPNIFTVSNKILYISPANIASLSELQQYLQQTPMSLTAIIVDPIETPLTPDEIAAYKALTAYAPDTVVQASDGAGVKLDYQRDINIVIRTLENRLVSSDTHASDTPAFDTPAVDTPAVDTPAVDTPAVDIGTLT